MNYIRKEESGELLIGTGNLPGRKKPCLYVGNEYHIQKVATFQNEGQKALFESYLEKFLGVSRERP